MDCKLREKAKFELVWNKLKELAIPTMLVEFEGSEKSEEVREVTPDWQHYPAPLSSPDYLATQGILNAATVVLNGEEMKLVDLAGDLSLDVMQECYESWARDDGGFGTVTWCANEDPPRIEIDYNDRYVAYTEHEYHCDRWGQWITKNEDGDLSQ